MNLVAQIPRPWSVHHDGWSAPTPLSITILEVMEDTLNALEEFVCLEFMQLEY